MVILKTKFSPTISVCKILNLVFHCLSHLFLICILANFSHGYKKFRSRFKEDLPMEIKECYGLKENNHTEESSLKKLILLLLGFKINLEKPSSWLFVQSVLHSVLHPAPGYLCSQCFTKFEVWIRQKQEKKRGNSYRKNEKISIQKAHTNTWKLN